jgi:hypothetical protein
MTDAGPVRSLTVDRARHDRVVRDLVAYQARARGSGWFLCAGAALLVMGITPTPWYADLGLLALVLWVQVIVWRQRAERSAERGLAVGQTVTVSYDERGDLTVTDATGQQALPRGSVALVRRTGGSAVVLGRSSAFVLPAELLSEDDVAFLEGHGASPVAPEQVQAGPQLPLAIEVTPAIQEQMVTAATRAVALTADFLLPVVVAAATVVFAVGTRLWPVLWLTLLSLLCSGPQLLGVHRTRARFRRTYRVGRVMRAAVRPDHLTLTRLHGTVVLPWTTWTGVRVTGDAVLLSRPRRRFGPWHTDVLPRGLFGPDDLARMTTALRRG